jgi:hypothetical protein
MDHLLRGEFSESLRRQVESAESAAHEARPNEIIGSTREEVRTSI